jgi:NAD(P)-dependent dehydrogenase (short-subunit alcohol dehydrogenase family)
VQRSVDTVIERHGGLDVLVNNAGLISPRKPYRDSDKEELLRYLTVNAVGYVLTTQAAHDALVERSRVRRQRGIAHVLHRQPGPARLRGQQGSRSRHYASARQGTRAARRDRQRGH